MKTPITYYGGKQNMAKMIIDLFPEHAIYNEPFFGGGAVFFQKKPAKIEFINDISGEVVNFYRQIKTNFCELKKEVDCTLHSEFQHKLAKTIYFSPHDNSNLERAWALWVLANQSFLSILGNTWAFDKKRNRAKTIAGKKEIFIHQLAERFENTSIFCRDAIQVIKNVDTGETLHYIDPPYFNSNMGHYGGYSESDFEALLICLSSIKGKFILSSFPSNLLQKYIDKYNWDSIDIVMNSPAKKNQNKTEVLTANFKITL